MLYHYGKAQLELKSEGSYERYEDAVEVAQQSSMYLDDIFAVWADNDPDTPTHLCWGGTVYSS